MNFQQWNNAQINQETDAEYTADPLRQGGAPTDSILPSPTCNKALYQSSTFITAFGMMMSGKGFDINDTDINVLAAVLANVLTNADIDGNFINVPFSPTPTLNAAGANGFNFSLTGNTSIQAINNLSAGQVIAFAYLQDGVGGRTVTFPTQMFSADPPDPTPGAYSIQLFKQDPYFGGFLRPMGPIISDNGLFIKNNANIGGAMAVAGAIAAAALTLSGNANISALFAAAATISGNISANSAAINATLTAGELVSNADTFVDGQLHAGSAAVTGNTQTATLGVTGNAQVNGNLNVGTLQIAGGAPNGQVPIGNGTDFIPGNLPVSVMTVHDVTGDRAFNTAIANPYGLKMTVSGSASTAGGSVGSVQALVDGVEVYAMTTGSTVDNGAIGWSFDVPATSTYQINANTLTNGQGSAVNGVRKWIETTWS